MHLSKNSLKKIRKILLKDWDPIGIGDCIEAEDEYDNYIPEIHNLVTSESEDKFLNYMLCIEEYIGLEQLSSKEHKELYYKLKRCLSQDR